MTKSQLIDSIAKKLPHVSRREVEAIVNTVFEAMTASLKREERIEIRGFGSFAVKVRHSREARNPKTGQKVAVPARKTPYFTVGKELRERLNKPAAAPAPASAPSAAYDAPPAMVASASTSGRYLMR